MHARILACVSAVSGIAASAGAQSVSIVIQDDDEPVPLLTVTSLDSVDVNNGGSWLAQVRTSSDALLVRDGVGVARENVTLADPPGSAIDFFGGARLDNSGNLGHRLDLDFTSGGNDDSGVFFNLDLVIQEGDFSLAPELSSSARWIGFFNSTRGNDLNQIFIVGSVDDPAIASSVDRVRVRADYEPMFGVHLETALAFESQPIGATGQSIVEVGTNPNQLSVNDAGGVMYFVDGDGAAAEDGFLFVTGAIAAQEGRPAPAAPGRNYESLSSRAHALSSTGAWAALVNLDGDTADDDCIVHSEGRIVAREGGTHPTFPGEAIESFGTGPIWISDRGEVLYLANFTGDAAGDEALLVEQEVLLREGDTVAGFPVTRIFGIQDGYAMSSNGRYVIVRVQLLGGAGQTIDAALLIDRGEQCPADLTGASDPNDPAYGVPDGTLDAADFFYYLDQFVAGNLAVADLTGSSDPNDPAYGIPDGTLDAADFFFYLDAFVEGC